ncbi:MAG: hypothetical protein RJA70_4041 [Pseudomonadota bacterium]|jgi:hypothetical protein
MFAKFGLILVVSSLAAGCAMSASSPVTGTIYTAAKGATAVTSNVGTSKEGRACASSILGAIGMGDASIASAAKQGGITKISTVDSDNFSVLGIYATNCTIVTGE